MKEIVIRTNIYNGSEHKLVYTGKDNLWEFKVAEAWMPISVTYDVVDDKKIYHSLDSDGFGYPITIGEKVEDKTVTSIIDNDDKFYITLE